MPIPPDELVALEADGLVLRAFRDTDRADLVDSLADPGIRLWNPGPDDATTDMFMAERNDWSDRTHASWAVAEPGPHGHLVGQVSLHHIDVRNENAEVGYWVAPRARRRGYAVRAVRAAATFAFETVGLTRVQLFHAVENEASCRVAASAGFALEGTSRQSYRFGDGELHDEHLHGRLRND